MRLSTNVYEQPKAAKSGILFHHYSPVIVFGKRGRPTVLLLTSLIDTSTTVDLISNKNIFYVQSIKLLLLITIRRRLFYRKPNKQTAI